MNTKINNKNGGCDSSTRLKTSWFPHTKDYEKTQRLDNQLFRFNIFS